jgi:tripartite-type tricarboxylate transporter receptor subunit TctC
MKMMWPLVRWPAMLALGFGWTFGATAQDNYPSKPISVISSQGVGGGVDALLRAIGQGLAERTGHGFTVDAKPGANGLLATNACANAKPDGYTICLVNTQYVLLPYLMSKPGYDPIKDFEPVTHVVTASLALAVQKDVPAKTLPELIAYSKANPGKLNYISLGAANPVDLGVEMLMRQHNVNWTAIPYKGAADSTLAFQAGDVQLMFITSLNVLAATKNGAGTMLFVTGDKRLPNSSTPTLAETPMPNAAIGGIWFGLIAPPGTPKAVREKLAREIAEVLKQPGIVKRAAETGYDLVGNGPDQFGAFLAKERTQAGAMLTGKPKLN